MNISTNGDGTENPIYLYYGMEINKWITEHYERLLSNACRITNHRDKGYDVLHQCLTEFLLYPEDKQKRLYDEGKLENYLTMCFNIQYKSNSSPYHIQHRKHQLMEVEYIDWKHYEIPEEEMSEYDIQCDCIFEHLPKLHFYYKELLTKKFIEGFTFNDMHHYYNISKNALLRDVKEGVKMLKQQCLTK